ncbi:MAG: hypothetical protein VKL23_05675 [Cyanobacteriota bacterium]|jgi:hypothetical protein|nr:hypothetical protein [Cyanobacteriota bacterium]
MVFNGSLDELKLLIAQLGVPCQWQHKGAFELAVFEDGVSNLKLNWWPRNGDLRLVGDPEVRDALQRRLEELLAQQA